ncbi:ATP-binding cassette domain-containing protein [Microbacterium sp. 22242]|uniref:ATP-binding cassette domain-containing protein n=1 Tax=Microbacterium sp. 22242 TaxID=3453896 RepID=UPI003F83F1BB
MSERPADAQGAMGGRLSVDLRAERAGFRMRAAFGVAPGEIVAVIGPNGSGKSTLLEAIAGQLPATGRVSIGGRVLDAPVGSGGPGAPRAIRLPPSERRLALLGQRALLFPHLSVLENVAFGPRAQGVPRAEARRRARARLEEVGLGAFASRRPAGLSGGQQQRAAIARALAAAPEALLLDEPFAALDAQTAAQARRLVAAQRDSAGIPIVLVTHDPMDALLLAARTLVMQDGAVVQEGATAEVLGHPRSDFVAAVAGVNRLAVTGAAGGAVRAAGLELRGHGDALRDGEHGTAVFAPGSVRVRAMPVAPAAAEPNGVNRWSGTVALLEPLPGGIRVHTVEQPGIAVDCPSTVAVTVGLRPGLPLAFELSADDVSVRRDERQEDERPER